MPYIKTVWEDMPNTATPISSANLNKIEDCLELLSTQTLTNVDTINGVQGSGILVRFGQTCQLTLTFMGQAGVNNVTLLQFPEGFRPYIDFATPVLDTDVHDVLGVAYYEAATNNLVFKNFLQNNFPCKLSVTYVTGD